MKERLCICLLAVLLLAALTAVPALADVIYEPNDAFYYENSDACDYHNRFYTTNGAGGTVAVLRAPGSDNDVAAALKNGVQLYVSFTYTDRAGNLWGVVEFALDDNGNPYPDYTDKAISGWIRMEEMKLVYDNKSFMEEHGGEFGLYQGSCEEFEAADEIVFWTYPGSGVIAGRLEDIDENFGIGETYTDEDGNLWGHIGYYYGIRDAWVCISDPSGQSLEVAPPPYVRPETSPPAETAVTPDIPKIPRDQTKTIILIVAIVAAVVVVTGVLIAVYWKKSDKTGIRK